MNAFYISLLTMKSAIAFGTVLSLASNGTVKTRLPPQTKKQHIFVIFHRKCYFNYLYISQRIRKFASLGEKNPKLATLFLALALRNLTVHELAYDSC
jgi:hypothetical protein